MRGSALLRLGFWPAAALLLLACGTPAKPVAAPPGAGSPVQLTEADSGHQVRLRLHQSLDVALGTPGGGNLRWEVPASDSPGVLKAVADPAATAAVGVTLARFEAVGAGTAHLSATGVASCRPQVACPAFAALWRVTVKVS